MQFFVVFCFMQFLKLFTCPFERLFCILLPDGKNLMGLFCCCLIFELFKLSENFQIFHAESDFVFHMFQKKISLISNFQKVKPKQERVTNEVKGVWYFNFITFQLNSIVIYILSRELPCRM